jgi:hypothetical protein
MEDIFRAFDGAMDGFVERQLVGYDLRRFGRGKPGTQVPPVSPADLKAACQIAAEHYARTQGRQIAIGMGVFQAMCSEGADLHAVTYRAMFIGLLPCIVPDVCQGERDEALYRVMAEIPMQWIGAEERQGPPFDESDFRRRLSAAREG